MPFDITAVIVQGIPESLVFVFLIYALLGVKAPWTGIAGFGLLHLGLMLVVRSTGAPFPAHTLVGLMVMSVVISLREQIALHRVIFAWAFGVVILIASETLFSILATSMIDLSSEELVTDQLMWILVGLPHVVVMALLAWWIHRRGGMRPFKALPG